MRLEQRTTTVEEKQTFIERIENLNPHHLFLYMSILGSAVVFVFLLLAFNLSYNPELSIELPMAFIASTIFLLIGNFAVRLSVAQHRKENMHKVVIYTGLAMMMGISYLLSQVVAWEQLYQQGIRISGTAFGSYVFLTSGLHVVHLLGGMTFLSFIFFSYIRASVDPVKALMLVTNPYQTVKLKMLVTCWNFLDIVWLAMMINFIIIL